MTLKIAKDSELPFEIAGRRTAIFGISGSGKSNTETVIVEGLLDAKEQVVLIDPKGEGWGLLSLANGKASDLDIVVFGEPNGHISPLNASHGPHIADFVVESGKSVVLSLLGFESDQSERRFVAAFLRQLYRRKSQQGRPTRTLVCFDEAHLFVPESAGRGFKGEAAELAGACQRIVRQGRSFGLGSLVVDQRPQDVAKRVISQCDTLICHQLVHKTDRDALRDWVRGYDRDGSGEKFLESVASLEPGEAWIWSPAWLKIFQKVSVLRRRTFDSGAAPDGSAAAKAVSRAEIDIDALRGQLAKVVEQAEENNPKKLKGEIAALKRELQKAQTDIPKAVAAVATKEVIKEVPIVPAKEIDALTKEIAGFRKDYIGRLDVIAQGFTNLNGNKHVERIETAINKLVAGIAPRQAVPARPIPARPISTVEPTPRSIPVDTGSAKLGKSEMAALRALYWTKDDATVDTRKIAFFAGYSPRASTIHVALTNLRKAGLVDGRILTDAGMEMAEGSGIGSKPTGMELREWIRGKVGKCENEVLDVLINNSDRTFTVSELAAETGYSAGASTLHVALTKLRKFEAIEGGGKEGVKAADVFFE